MCARACTLVCVCVCWCMHTQTCSHSWVSGVDMWVSEHLCVHVDGVHGCVWVCACMCTYIPVLTVESPPQHGLSEYSGLLDSLGRDLHPGDHTTYLSLWTRLISLNTYNSGMWRDFQVQLRSDQVTLCRNIFQVENSPSGLITHKSLKSGSRDQNQQVGNLWPERDLLWH